ncbi:MAG: radical SAM protein [Candidatus Aegiribacteria sp.]|nr:radical SAM protein [Candidatus Aegiribacteria sp.]
MGSFSNYSQYSASDGTGFFSRNGYSKVPVLVQWISTLKCDLSCPHCLSVSLDNGFTDMPLQAVMKLIDEIVEMGVEEFLVTGGEPLARNDLPMIIDYLGFREQNWTLNTAVMPSAYQRKRLAENSPGFVAVSLDGPREIHDSFRGRKGAWEEAIEAISFFKSLPGVRVCAGTTVTSINERYLEETFQLVAASGADQWGIHLLVPEGRAAYRSDLFLSKRQLRQLIRFVARKRQYFNVEMADEIGYLGNFEPLVRDFPLTCGAGKSQCVILPDGEVVPCTTLDRSFSAGNIHQRPLREIWEDGFRKLRKFEPEGKCDECIYYPACKSGCWLQRKNGKECFREIWHVPDSLKTAAGITVCLGALASGLSRGAEIRTAKSSNALPLQIHMKQIKIDSQSVIFDPELTDGIIMGHYVELSAGYRSGTLSLLLDRFDTEDPAWDILSGFQYGTLPQNITDRCELVMNALNTEYPSLSLAALMWRVVNEPFFDTEKFSENEMKALYSTLEALHQKTCQWRLAIFENRLDPYLRNDRFTDPPFFMYSKAGPRPGDVERHYLTSDLNIERWGTADDTPGITAEYLLEHPYADQMNLIFRSSDPVDIRMYSSSGSEPLNTDSGGRYIIGIFDVIESDEDAMFLFEIVSTGGSEIPYDYESKHDDESGENHVSALIEVSIERGRKYTYIDILRSAYHQRRGQILAITSQMLSEANMYDEGNTDYMSGYIMENETLLWPGVREIAGSEMDSSTLIANRFIDIEEIRSRAVKKDIDFWMF